MALIDEILEFDRARAERRDAPVPVTGGRRVACVVCPEMLAEGTAAVARRIGLDPEDVAVVAVPGARVQHADGDVARAVALAAGRAASGAPAGASDVLVLAHEDCAYRAPSFGVPGSPPPGESFASAADLVRAAVTSLRASPWLRRDGHVLGLVAASSGRLEQVVGLDAPAGATPAFAAGGAPAPSGPVSFFGGGAGSGGGASLGAAGSLGGAPSSWDAPSPTLAGPSGPMDPGPALSAAGEYTALGGSASKDLGSAAWSSPIPRRAAMPEVGRPPPVTAERPAEPWTPDPRHPAAPPEPPPLPRARGEDRPPPPPKPATPPKGPQAQRPRRPASGEDPFARAEEILERLRRERRK